MTVRVIKSGSINPNETNLTLKWISITFIVLFFIFLYFKVTVL